MTKYFREIDSLRAIAVIAVIINHIDKSWLTGGFLGVDIFFVISGFVVTASLQGKKKQSFSKFIKMFYRKRLKRLYPGLIGCIFLTSLFVFIFLPTNNFYIKTGFNALFGLSNLFLARSSFDYFSVSSEANPFTHTWSLGVEEQFYLFFPLLFYCFSKKNFLRFLTLISLVTLSLFAFYEQTNPIYAFYMMPLRFWQFGIGALVFLSSKTKALNQLPKDFILLPITFMVLLLNFSGEFNAYATVLITLVTALTLVLIKEGSQERKYLVLKPVLYIGLASYSLYLYHWPVLVFFKQTMSLDGVKGLICFTLIALFSLFSYHYLEKYFRQRIWQKKEKSVFFILFFICILFKFETSIFEKVLFVGTSEEAYSFYDNPQYDIKSLRRCTARGGSKISFYTQLQFSEKYLNKCKIIKGKNKSIYYYGNSHAQEKAPSIIRFSKDYDFNLHYYTRSGVHIYPYDIEVENNPSLNYTKFYFDTVANEAKYNDIVIISIALKKFLINDIFTNDKGELVKGSKAFEIFIKFLIEKTIEMHKKGVHLILTDGYPILKQEVIPVNCYQSWSFNNKACLIDNAIDKDITEKLRGMDRRLLEEKKINYISLFNSIESAYEKVQMPLRLYRDENHLTHFGNKFIYPHLEKEILRIIKEDIPLDFK